MKILRDEDFIRKKVPMTKFPLRAEIFFRLGLNPGEKFLDIGTGTGSISVQAALLGAEVWGIDLKTEAVELTRGNADKFGADLNLINGKAPEDLPDEIFDKAFIGGASKVLPEVLDYLKIHLKPEGILCANFIMISSLNDFIKFLKEKGFEDIEVGLRQAANMTEIGLWKGENPIYIVSARRGI